MNFSSQADFEENLSDDISDEQVSSNRIKTSSWLRQSMKTTETDFSSYDSNKAGSLSEADSFQEILRDNCNDSSILKSSQKAEKLNKFLKIQKKHSVQNASLNEDIRNLLQVAIKIRKQSEKELLLESQDITPLSPINKSDSFKQRVKNSGDFSHIITVNDIEEAETASFSFN